MEHIVKFVGISLGLLMLAFVGVSVFDQQTLREGAVGEAIKKEINEEKIPTDLSGSTTLAGTVPAPASREEIKQDPSKPKEAPAQSGEVPKTTLLEEAKTPPSSVSTPGTLIMMSGRGEEGATSGAPILASDGAVNQQDIFLLTNNARGEYKLPGLSFSKKLSEIAEKKALDMITQQYFAHKSPQGVDVGELADIYGYEYLNIGENLALGDFKESGGVVTGWMNSPGHRANILNDDFTEIGVAAVWGNWEGRMVWYAVQEFGRPLSACPKPETLLKEKIAIYQTELSTLEKTLDNLKKEIDALSVSHPEYAKKAKDYNTIVELYNQLVGTLRTDIEKYNAQARAFNVCAGVEG